MMQDVIAKAKQYQGYSQIMTNAHYKAAEADEARARQLGILVVVLTALVGTSIFADVAKQNPAFTLLLGFVSFLAAALSGVQTFLDFSKRAANHQVAAKSYESFRHRFDSFFLKYADGDSTHRQVAVAEFEKLAEDLGQADKQSPLVPDKIYESVKKSTPIP